MAITSLKMNSVSNGSLFDLKATEVNYGFKEFINSPQETSRPAGSPYDYRLPKATYQGHAAGVISIRGFIDIVENKGANHNNFITLVWLGSLALAAGSTAFLFDDAIQQFNGLGSVPVVISTIDFTRSPLKGLKAGSENIVDYSMTLIETRTL